MLRLDWQRRHACPVHSGPQAILGRALVAVFMILLHFADHRE